MRQGRWFAVVIQSAHHHADALSLIEVRLLADAKRKLAHQDADALAGDEDTDRAVVDFPDNRVDRRAELNRLFGEVRVEAAH